MEILTGIVYFVAVLMVIRNGHRDAVNKSEAVLRALYEKQGDSGKSSRELMRQAGYNV